MNKARVLEDFTIMKDFEFKDLGVEGILLIYVKYADVYQTDNEGNFSINTAADYAVNIKAEKNEEKVKVKECEIELERFDNIVKQAITDTVQKKILETFENLKKRILDDEDDLGEIKGRLLN